LLFLSVSNCFWERWLTTFHLFLYITGEERRKYVWYMPWPQAAECNMITNKQTMACVQVVALYWRELWWDLNQAGRRDDLQLPLNRQARPTLGALPTTQKGPLMLEVGQVLAEVLLNYANRDSYRDYQTHQTDGEQRNTTLPAVAPYSRGWPRKNVGAIE